MKEHLDIIKHKV